MTDASIEKEVMVAVAAVASSDCGDPTLHLLEDLGIDSLSLLRLIKLLEARFDVTIPDESTGQAQTVGDLAKTVRRLVRGPTR